MTPHTPLRRIGRTLCALGAMMVLIYSMDVPQVIAASSWNPTLLVNTESFQTIDEGDSTTNIEIRFGQTLNQKLYYDRTNNQFVFTNSLKVGGNITATGSITAQQGFSGSSLKVYGAGNFGGNVGAAGTLTASGAIKARGGFTGSTLNIMGTASIGGNTTIGGAASVTGNINTQGTLSATGAISTNANGMTINSKNNSTDDALTFGDSTAAQTLKYLHSGQKFQFSKDVSVKGNMSGSTMTVDGDMTIRGITYHMPTAAPTQGQVLKANDNSNNLVWGNSTIGNSSGGILPLQPTYPGAAYFGSGTAVVGTLTSSYDGTNKYNYYHWVSSKTALNEYWIAVRAKVPKNFTSWDSASPIQFNYRTLTTSATDNVVTMKLIDTAGNLVSISGNGNLVSSTANTWALATVSGVSGGTYTPGSNIIILVRLVAKSTGSADIGTISLNWGTSTP